jgi:hypothetical protein
MVCILLHTVQQRKWGRLYNNIYRIMAKVDTTDSAVTLNNTSTTRTPSSYTKTNIEHLNFTHEKLNQPFTRRQK